MRAEGVLRTMPSSLLFFHNSGHDQWLYSFRELKSGCWCIKAFLNLCRLLYSGRRFAQVPYIERSPLPHQVPRHAQIRTNTIDLSNLTFSLRISPLDSYIKLGVADFGWIFSPELLL
jgi:hypothetical protein